MNGNDCGRQKRQPEERHERKRSQTRNLFHVYNLDWVSTTHTKRERCEKSWHWHGHVEKLQPAKSMSMQPLVPRVPSSNDYKLRLKRPFEMVPPAMIQDDTTKSRQQSQAPSNYRHVDHFFPLNWRVLVVLRSFLFFVIHRVCIGCVQELSHSNLPPPER